jgi:uncharacterized protein YdeI (YjbR/CyaY-like superfamily)
MERLPALEVKNRREWRAWLRKHHAGSDGVELVFFKKHTGRQSIAYAEALEEALCFGWIDGLKRRIDDERYSFRFTPRKPRSKWSPRNIEMAQRLIDAGKMAAAGQAAFERRRVYAPETLEKIAEPEPPLSPELEKAIRSNRKAWKHFNDLAPGYRKRYVQWLMAAKRPETRKKRLAEVIAELAAGRKPGMK